MLNSGCVDSDMTWHTKAFQHVPTIRRLEGWSLCHLGPGVAAASLVDDLIAETQGRFWIARRELVL